jgi:voltage-gated potassium channel
MKNAATRWGLYGLMAYLLYLPGYLFSRPSLLNDDAGIGILLLLYIAGTTFIAIWGIAIQFAYWAALHLYSEPMPDGKYMVRLYGLIPVRLKLSKINVLLSTVWAYVMTIYGFALVYLSFRTGEPFTQPITSLTTAIYFSITTISTVGYGDFAPKSDGARIVVSTEILAGVAYSVFFFSIIAGFIRDRALHDKK